MKILLENKSSFHNMLLCHGIAYRSMAYIRYLNKAFVRHCYTKAHIFVGRVVLQPNNHVTVKLPNRKWMVEETNMGHIISISWRTIFDALLYKIPLVNLSIPLAYF